jgi:hypothetical protein
MISTRTGVSVGGFVTPQYSLETKPVGDKTDVRLNKKEIAKPKHWVFFAAAAVIGVAVIAYKMEDSFTKVNL